MRAVLAAGFISLFLLGTFAGVVTVISVNARASPPFSVNIRVDDDTGTSDQCHPSIDVDINGNIYVVWKDGRVPFGDIFFAKSTNSGTSFGTSVQVGEGGGALFPAVAVDRSGNVFVSWEDYRNNNWNIYFANSTDGGSSFSCNVRVNDNATARCRSSSIAVDDSGYVYIVWYDNRNTSSLSQDIYFAKSTNMGSSFSANVRVNDDASGGKYYPKIAVSVDGNIYVVWQDNRNRVSGGPANYDIYFAKSTDGGISFNANLRVNDDSTQEGQWYPAVSVDNNGTIYIAWVDNRDSTHDIYFSKSIDNGTSFTANRRVNEINAGTTGRWLPDIAVDVNGHIHIVWVEERNGARDIYYSKSTDGGLTFGPDIKVNDVPGSAYYGPSIAADEYGNVYVVWEDSRNGNYDIYFATTNPAAILEFSMIIIPVFTMIAVFVTLKKVKKEYTVYGKKKNSW